MLKVLVVDDQAVMRLELGRLIRAAGHQFVAVGGGANAVELLSTTCFCLMLLDQNMPGLSGFDVLRQLKTATVVRRPPVVLFATSQESGREAVALGADRFILKTTWAEIEPILTHYAQFC